MKYSTRMADLLMQVESKKALDKKSKKSGMPKGILSKVYDRGMAAWKGGHRPGTTPQQWALARVNSFITKSSGTWGGADSDLAKQVRGRAESVEEAMDVKYDKTKQGWFDRQGRRRYLGKSATNDLMKKKLDKAIATGDWTTFEEVEFDLEESRQLKNKDTEMLVVKHSKVIVIDKTDWQKYKAKGYMQAESYEELEEKMKHISFDKARPQLPPHLKKLFDKDGNFINPKSQAVFDKMVKDAGGFDGLRKKFNIEEEDLPEACWDSHKQVGTKMKGGKRVPNCVPKNEDKDDGHTKSLAKDKQTGEPKKYVSGLSDKDKAAHKRHLDRQGAKDDDDKSAYKQSPADKKAKTKPSKHTKKFKQMYGETKELLEFTKAQIKTLEREYAPLKGRTMSGEQIRKMSGMLKKYDKSMLQKLANASIPMLTTGAKSELVINRGMKWTDFKESLKIENADAETATPAKKKKGEDKDAVIDRLEKENQLLKVRNLEKSQKTVEPNRDTGEVPLKVGLAQKILKDMKDGKKVELPKKNKKEIKLDKKPTKVETKPTMDISPSAGGHDTEAPAKEK
jgi:hypothetical protein